MCLAKLIIIFVFHSLLRFVENPKISSRQEPSTSTTVKGPLPKASMSNSRPCGKKIGSFEVSMERDKNDCWITGIAVDKNGNKLLADRNNKIVKLFSPEMKALSCVVLPSEPWDLAMIGDNEAVVACEYWLGILQVTDSKLKIKTKTKMPFNMRGICQCKDKLIVTSPFFIPRSVKLINLKGKTDWSVSSDKGTELFVSPLYVSKLNNGSSSVVVTDGEKGMVTCINGDTGKVLAKWHKKVTEPTGVTTDINGNIYICNSKNHEIVILNEDLTEESVFLKRKDGLSTNPHTIAYDPSANQLVVGYAVWNIKLRDSVDVFQIE